MKIVLGQINPTVGDILGNYKKIVTNISEFNNKADLYSLSYQLVGIH